jgi:hypothetical protein
VDLKPFIQLATPREVNRPELPPDLVEFYASHEGIGLESDPDRTVRLCRLDEVVRVRWKDFPWGKDEYLEACEDFTAFRKAWEDFAAVQIGMGSIVVGSIFASFGIR